MGRITDEGYTPRPPAVLFEPLDTGAMDLLVHFQAGQVDLDKAAEVAEPTPKARQTTLDWVVLVIVTDVGKPVRRALADRAQPEEAPISQPELHARRPIEFDRGDAAPRDLTGKRRADIAEHETAH